MGNISFLTWEEMSPRMREQFCFLLLLVAAAATFLALRRKLGSVGGSVWWVGGGYTQDMEKKTDFSVQHPTNKVNKKKLCLFTPSCCCSYKLSRPDISKRSYHHSSQQLPGKPWLEEALEERRRASTTTSDGDLDTSSYTPDGNLDTSSTTSDDNSDMTTSITTSVANPDPSSTGADPNLDLRINHFCHHQFLHKSHHFQHRQFRHDEVDHFCCQFGAKFNNSRHQWVHKNHHHFCYHCHHHPRGWAPPWGVLPGGSSSGTSRKSEVLP